MKRARLAPVLGLLAVLSIPTLSSAHGRSVSYSIWDLDGARATVTLRLTRLELTRLRPEPLGGSLLDASLAAYFTEHLALVSGEVPCPLTRGPYALDAPPGKVAFEWEVECEAPATGIHSSVFLDVASGHLHFARLRPRGEPAVERVLSLGEPLWSFPSVENDAKRTLGSSLSAYLYLGIEHIATGYDHLVFVLALLLLASRFAEVATIVTGFTLAHSITLGLAVFGHLRPEPTAVEALIGLSIALVAAENAWLLSGRHRSVPWAVSAALLVLAALALAGIGSLAVSTSLGLCLFAGCYFAILARVSRPMRVRIAIAFVFGLVHGFGFAGVLGEIELEPERLATALLGFNLGVEIGQLAVIAIAWPLLRIATRGRSGRLILESVTGAIAATGVFWLVSRAFA